jgi:hypothetical protein
MKFVPTYIVRNLHLEIRARKIVKSVKIVEDNYFISYPPMWGWGFQLVAEYFREYSLLY